MNPTDFAPALIDFVAQQAPWAALAVARPFGLTIIFYAFAWGHLNSGMIRMAFALAIAAPSIGSGLPIGSVEALPTAFPVLLVKEVFLGGLIGLIASAPLAIALGAGGIIDIYRGSSSGTPDPAGGDATPVATLLTVISLWIFASVGGFWIVARMIYQSYTLWPAPDPLPAFSPDLTALWAFAGGIALSALVLAGPVLALLFFSDVVHLVSVKFGKQINVSQMAFTSKNLLMAAVLPVFLLYAFRTLKGHEATLGNSLVIVRSLFQ